MRIFIGERTIELALGDITRQEVDAIINAANSSLMGGGGVDGAIHQAGGPDILEDCKMIVTMHGPLPPGQAVATTAGQLPARHVIHTVGPIWQGGNCGEPETLASCYRESLQLADELGLESVAFPSISIGAFGYPLQEAAEVAVSTVQEGLLKVENLRLTRFVLFDHRSFDAYAKVLRTLDRDQPARH